MIYFANNPIPHIIPASTTAKAIVKIYDGTTLLNEKSLLLSYPIDSKYNFDLSCFFKFYKALQLPVPSFQNPVEYLGLAKTFTVKTYVNDVLIDTKTYDVVAGSSNFGFARYFKQFLTHLPNTVEILEDELLFRYIYLKVANLTKFHIEAVFVTDTGEEIKVIEQPIPYQEGLYCLDFSVNRFRQYLQGKSIKTYRVGIRDKYGVYLYVTLKVNIDQRANYYPVQLLYRNRLGVFESYRFTSQTAPSEVSYSKSYLANNEEINTYAENRNKLKLSTKPLRQSEIDTLVENISTSLEIYQTQNGELRRLIQSATSYLKFDVKEVQPSLQLEFQYSQVEEHYV
jgi:hypothetical protein